ncbi:MAG TPA: hypothetical protein VKY65_06615 [Alphaproteobacteria bacterium]|nr:hypothetical protein [Alphaproteobacteria bacterium]
MGNFSRTSQSSARLGSRVAPLHRVPAAANDNEPRHRFEPPGPLLRSYLILLLVGVGVALFYWLATAFVDWDRVQSCVTLGHRNCVPSIPLDQQ